MCTEIKSLRVLLHCWGCTFSVRLSQSHKHEYPSTQFSCHSYTTACESNDWVCLHMWKDVPYCRSQSAPCFSHWTILPRDQRSFTLGFRKMTLATTRYLYIVCIYGAICLQILFLKHHILLFCHEILKFFAYICIQHRVELICYFFGEKIAGSGGKYAP